MNYNRKDEEFASDILFCRNKPVDIVRAIRSDTVQACFDSLLVAKKSTTILTESHKISIVVRKRRVKK